MLFTLVHPHMSGFLVLVTCFQFVLGMREYRVRMVWMERESVCVCVCV